MPVLNNWSPPRVSQLMVDADLNLTSAYKLIAAGVQACPGEFFHFYEQGGGLRGRFGNTTFTVYWSSGILCDIINEYTPGNGVKFPDGIKTDSIDDNGAGTIDILESVAFAAGKSASLDSLLTDGISERTGSANISLNSKVLVDHIGEKTASHDIVFDDDIQAQEDFEAKLTQDYLTAAAGDTDRYTSASEESVDNPGASPGVPIKSVTVPVEYADPNCTFRITYTAKRSGTLGTGMKASICINGVVKSIGASLDEVYDVRSVDLTGITAGDVISINGYGDGAYTVYVKDFAVKSTDSVYTPAGASPTWT